MATSLTTNGKKKISTFKKEFSLKFNYLTIQFLDKKRKEYDNELNLVSIRTKKGEDISISGQNKINSLESKFEKIRRKLSYELDKDLKSSEVVPILLEKAYDSSKIVKEKPLKSHVHLIFGELARGTTVAKCAEKYGVSMSTIFRYKAKLRETNY